MFQNVYIFRYKGFFKDEVNGDMKGLYDFLGLVTDWVWGGESQRPYWSVEVEC